MGLADQVRAAFEAAGEHTEKQMTLHLRKTALEAGWPVEAAKKVEAHFHEGHMHSSFEGAEDWEYGTLDRPPLAVARVFDSNLHGHASKTFDAALSHHLQGLL